VIKGFEQVKKERLSLALLVTFQLARVVREFVEGTFLRGHARGQRVFQAHPGATKITDSPGGARPPSRRRFSGTGGATRTTFFGEKWKAEVYPVRRGGNENRKLRGHSRDQGEAFAASCAFSRPVNPLPGGFGKVVAERHALRRDLPQTNTDGHRFKQNRQYLCNLGRAELRLRPNCFAGESAGEWRDMRREIMALTAEKIRAPTQQRPTSGWNLAA
jgi:hypothetical protein